MKLWTPHTYQRDMLDHVFEHDRCALFAGMGTGKTSSTLAALDALSLVEDPFPALVVAPLRVAQSTWPDEVRKWANLSHLEVQPILGDPRTRAAALRNPNAAIFTINYENLPWLREHLGKGVWPFPTVVADEATRLKGFRLRQGTKSGKALGQIAHSKVRRWINLTGTPAPNGLKDLWGQSWFLDQGRRLGRTHQDFVMRWFHPDPNGYGVKPTDFAQEQMQDQLADICLTVKGLDVEKPIVNKLYVDLPSRARSLYRDMDKTFFAQLDARTEVEAFNAASKSQKLLQLAAGAIYTDDEHNWKEIHDAKIRALESVVEEAAGAPVLVAYYFKSDLARLLRAFPNGRELDARPQTIRDWNAGRIPVLFAHPASAGHGLNLQDGGNILAFFSLTWNLEHHDQIVERIGPMRQKQAGHDRPVFVHYIMARDTIDDLVYDRLVNKRGIQDVLLEALRRRT